MQLGENVCCHGERGSRCCLTLYDARVVDADGLNDDFGADNDDEIRHMGVVSHHTSKSLKSSLLAPRQVFIHNRVGRNEFK